MSDEDIQRVEELMKALEERLEKRLTDTAPQSKPPPKNGLSGWKAAGLVLSVLTAVTAPVLGVTWYASTKMNQLEGVQRELDQTRGDMATFRAEVGSDIGELRKDVQRLREAFAAYTQTILPMIVRDPLDMSQFRPPVLPQTPRVPANPGAPQP